MDKKTVVAITVCVALLIAWFPLMRRLGWLPAPPPVAVEAAAAPADGAPAAPSGETGDEPVAPWPPPAVGDSTPVATAIAPAAAAEAAMPPPQPQRLESAEVSFLVDPATGAISRAVLHRYQADDRESPVTLGSPAYPFLALRVPGGSGAARLLAADETHVAVERTLPGSGVRLRQSWQVDPARPYTLACVLEFHNPGADTVRLEGLQLTAGSAGLARVGGGGFFGTPQVLNADVAFREGARAKTFTHRKIKDLEAKGEAAQALWRRDLTWAALHTQYFVFFLAAPDTPFAGVDLHVEGGEKGGPAELHGSVLLPPVTLAAGDTQAFTVEGYAGPKEYQRLRDLGRGAHGILQMDLFMFFHAEWMGAVSRVVLKTLFRIQEAIRQPWGYGVGIIVITVLVKILFWPLTHYTTASMKRMSALQPQMQELRRKYSDDPARMQQKIMELYREHKINPASGCLPMLLQIPVFFALFNVFRNAIELRQAPFLWVQDLSQPDTLPWLPLGLPIRPFGLLSAGTMYLQQRLTPTAADPQQARMMTVMTVFFGFLFYGMPAGLTLYWTVNQVLSIALMFFTHWWLNRRAGAAGAATPAAGARKPA
jgi:YidC/Oxa1 family membrane protein insertase